MFIKIFKQLSKKDVDIAGGKGASLGEMTQAGIPVPPGFVVLASAFDKFLEETPYYTEEGEADLNIAIQAELNKINYQDVNSVDRYSNVIRDLIADSAFPKDLKKEILAEFKKLKAEYTAVRSSATAEDSSIASWAGELETYLNVSEKNLFDSIKKCWSSLFTPRAIFYRFEKNLQKRKVSVAVVIQKMVQSDISGICFTVHPVNKDKNQMVIEAGFGLGEAIVGGRITPDSYIIDKKRNKIIDKNISEQKIMIIRQGSGIKETEVPELKQERQKLPDKQILKLAKLCQQIEKHYKIPQDIEFAIEKNKIYIVQSRPITTL